MAHAHAHGEAEGNYFLDQLFTILTCGGVGLVAVLMYQTGMLSRILVPMFFVPVLLGGSAILALVVVRAIAVWQLAGARRELNSQEHSDYQEHPHAHAHSHSHGDADNHEDCGHDHGTDCNNEHSHSHAHSHDHDHSHAAAPQEDHGHDHGWAPWRYMVLAIPVFLYFLGLPREGLSDRQVRDSISSSLQNDPRREGLSILAGGSAMTPVLRKPFPQRFQLKFKELTEAAAIPARHGIYDGDIGIIRGQYVPLRTSDREFTLLRVDMTCCVADQIYLETRIIAPDPIQGIQPYQWVRLEGLISFQKNEKGKWIPVITLASNDAIDPNAEPTKDANAP